jgi:hypothetical protein
MAKIIQSEPSPFLYAQIRKLLINSNSLPFKLYTEYKGFLGTSSSSEAEHYQPIMELLKGVKPSYVNV